LENTPRAVSKALLYLAIGEGEDESVSNIHLKSFHYPLRPTFKKRADVTGREGKLCEENLQEVFFGVALGVSLQARRTLDSVHPFALHFHRDRAVEVW
jgi:hypothetical protein